MNITTANEIIDLIDDIFFSVDAETVFLTINY
jgi:hypothetical protein